MFNTAILIDRLGNIVLKYRKINVLEEAFDFYEIGNCLSTIETNLGELDLIFAPIIMQIRCIYLHYIEWELKSYYLRPHGLLITPTEDDDPYHDKWMRPYKYITKLYENVLLELPLVIWLAAL